MAHETKRREASANPVGYEVSDLPSLGFIVITESSVTFDEPGIYPRIIFIDFQGTFKDHHGLFILFSKIKIDEASYVNVFRYFGVIIPLIFHKLILFNV